MVNMTRTKSKQNHQFKSTQPCPKFVEIYDFVGLLLPVLRNVGEKSSWRLLSSLFHLYSNGRRCLLRENLKRGCQNYASTPSGLFVKCVLLWSCAGHNHHASVFCTAAQRIRDWSLKISAQKSRPPLIRRDRSSVTEEMT